MFTYSCILNKCSDDIQNKLKSLGYLYNSNGSAYGNNSIIYTIGDNYYLKKDYKSIARDRSKQFIQKAIDCGDNEDLFLAIAALRDDIDEGQWFIIDVDAYVLLSAGDWFKATDMNGHYHVGTGIDPLYCHKATVEELIEHFKENGN